MAGVGHFGVGFAAKRFAPKVPLVWLLIASEAIDLFYIVFMLVGIDNVNAGFLTHSLLMAVVWTVATFLLVLLISRNLRSSIVMGLLVFSHWLLDFIVWPMTAIYPDATGMPLYFDSPTYVGLGLYRLLPMVIIGEILLLGGGIIIYIFWLRKTRQERKAFAGSLEEDKK